MTKQLSDVLEDAMNLSLSVTWIHRVNGEIEFYFKNTDELFGDSEINGSVCYPGIQKALNFLGIVETEKKKAYTIALNS